MPDWILYAIIAVLIVIIAVLGLFIWAIGDLTVLGILALMISMRDR